MAAMDKLNHALTQGDWKAADEILSRLVRRAPGEASLLYNLGRVKMERGQWPAARTWLRKAIAAAPGHAHAWFELGRTELQLGDLAAAQRGFAKAVALDPADADAHLNLARIALRLGAFAEVRAALAPLAGQGAEIDALRYRAAAELGLPEAGEEAAALWSRSGARAEALKALTRVAKGRLPLDL
ncbi:tetratricopeptide repeat protein [Oceanicola sp. S124]|uniref:tetratricopeptide repeat protein n=1 Tax=Oceanicola sp. S124 TaxID=1042378 RepID=UPI0002558533|nr:tetratricopeptide repeat protein [Oceanicola sp. S124]